LASFSLTHRPLAVPQPRDRSLKPCQSPKTPRCRTAAVFLQTLLEHFQKYCFRALEGHSQIIVLPLQGKCNPGNNNRGLCPRLR